MIKPQEVKYRVGPFFGNTEAGSIINAILIEAGDGDNGVSGLLFHPKSKDEYGCFEFATQGNDGIWESAARRGGWMNVYSKEIAKKLFGKKFTYRRKVFKA